MLHDWFLGIYHHIINILKAVFSNQLDLLGSSWWTLLKNHFVSIFAEASNPIRKLCKGIDLISQFDGSAFHALVHFLPFAVLAFNHSRIEPLNDVLLGIAITARIVLDRMQVTDYTRDFAALTLDYQKK